MSVFRSRGPTREQMARLVTPSLTVGRWYGQQFAFATFNYVMAANKLYATPLYFPRPMTVTGLAARITTGAVGSLKMGLYTYGTGYLAPGDLLGEGSADLDTSTSPTNAEQAFAAPIQAPAGWYWGALCFSGTPTVASFSAAAISAGGFSNIVGTTNSREALSPSTAPVARLARTAALTYVPAANFFPATFGPADLIDANTAPPLMAWRAA